MAVLADPNHLPIGIPREQECREAIREKLSGLPATRPSILVCMWSDHLSVAEVEGTRRAAKALDCVSWATQLVEPLKDDVWWLPSHKPLMFEVRLAAELHASGCIAQYEFDAGVGGKTIDFRVQTDSQQVLVELVSVGESDAVKSATKTLKDRENDVIEISELRLSTTVVQISVEALQTSGGESGLWGRERNLAE